MCGQRDDARHAIERIKTNKYEEEKTVTRLW